MANLSLQANASPHFSVTLRRAAMNETTHRHLTVIGTTQHQQRSRFMIDPPTIHSVRRILPVVRATPAETATEGVEEDAMERMDKSMESVQRNFSTVRTGRANAAMLDRIDVDYYGASTPLKQIAGISTPEATLLVIQPYDISAIPAIERAIQQSDIGLTPNNDGKVIRLQIPQLTADRRKEMTKIVSKLGEEGKVAIRNVRRDAMKTIEKLEKDSIIGEDQRKDLEAVVQKMTDDYVKEVDGLMKSKNDELSKV